MKKTILLAAAMLSAAAINISAAETVTVSLNPADGATVHSIKEIDLKFSDMMDTPKNISQKAYICREGDETRIPCTEFSFDYSDYANYMKIGTLYFPEITGAGKYTLTIEAGAFSTWFDATAVTPKVTATYTINPTQEAENEFSVYSFTPAADKPLVKISSIRVTFPKAPGDTKANQDMIKDITLSDGGTTYHCVECTGYSREWTFFFAAAPEATQGVTITAPGTYTLTIPAGVIDNGIDPDDDSEGLYAANKEITASFIIADDIDFAYTCTPENGASQMVPAEANTFTVTFSFPDANAISTAAATPGAKMDISLDGNALIPVENPAMEQGYQLTGSQYGSLTITVSASLLGSLSVLTVDAEKGAFSCEGLPSPAIEYSATFTEPKDFTFTTTPKSGATVSELTEVSVAFTNAEKISKQYFCYDNSAILTDLKNPDNTFNSKAIVLSEEDEYPGVTVTFAEGIPDGLYRFALPAELLLLDNEASPLVTATFTLNTVTDGIGEITCTPVSEIFTIDGRRVDSTALSSGIYIIRTGNGVKKHIIR